MSGTRTVRAGPRPLGTREAERVELLAALSATPRRLPARLLYDRRGSALFEAITRTSAYYPTRTETGILRANAALLSTRLGAHARIVEFGTGSGSKTRILLEAAQQPSAYIPVDVACAQLQEVATQLRQRYPTLRVLPVCADYNGHLNLPVPDSGGRTVVFFPGSTIGNMEPREAEQFLRRLSALVVPDGLLIIGVDRKKDRATLELAYNDPQGITAAFNLNILNHVNRILGSDFHAHAFRHHAFYNDAAGRIEMHLVSTTDQVVHIPDGSPHGIELTFRADESIITEHSYKYTPDEFRTLAQTAGFATTDVLSDARERFSVFLLEPFERLREHL